MFFDDVFSVIPRLKLKYKLAIVSDAWPSLKDVYEEKELFTYFDSFVISSILGITKPNEKMFQAAINEIGVKPQETIFIDDNINNCERAMKLGIKAVFICRNRVIYCVQKICSIKKGYRVIYSLKQLENIIEQLNFKYLVR